MNTTHPACFRSISRLSILSATVLLALGPMACADEELLGADAESDTDPEDDADTEDFDSEGDSEGIDAEVYDPDTELDLDLVNEDEPLALTTTELSTLLLGSNYTITSYHNPVAGGHIGMDFAAPSGTTVRSPVTGTVIANTTTCGKVAVFDGTNTVILAHMSNLSAPAVGSPISIGTIVGKVSNVTGGGCTATGAHLHIEIRTGQNASMGLAGTTSSSTTLNPLTYTYSPFKAVTLTSPSSGATVTTNPVSFSWASQQGANSYRLQISSTNAFTSETCTYGCVYNVANQYTSRSVTLNPGTYYWRVRAGNSGQGGYWSVVRTLYKS